MFGTSGVFCDGLMFAMVANDTLYFRVDDDNPAMAAARRVAEKRTPKHLGMRQNIEEST